jgi:hypothetical protein
MYEHATLTLKIKGAKSGVFSYWMDKGITDESLKELDKMSKKGWEMVGAVPLAVGAVGGQWVDSAIGFFKREIKSNVEIRKNSDWIEEESFNTLLKRKHFEEQLGERLKSFNDFSWENITKFPFPEALPVVEKYLLEAEEYYNNEKCIEFYSLMDHESRSISLFNLLEKSKNDEKILALIYKFKAFNFSHVIYLIKEDDIFKKLRGVKAAFSPKPAYVTDDIKEFTSLKEIIIEEFPKAKLQESKKMMGGTKNVWLCIKCDSKNDETEDVCKRCYSDMHGLGGSYDMPGGKNEIFKHVINKINRRIEVLENFFEATS